MTTTSEAYILVTLPNATLTSSSLSSSTGTGTRTLTGHLALEYVTFDIPTTATTVTSGAAVTQDVLLVLVLRTGAGNNSNSNNNNVAFEAPLDPARALTVSSVPPSGARRYVFHATRDDVEFTVELPVVTEDVELFHSVLEGYVADLRVHGELLQSQSARGFVEGSAVGPEGEDLRGRFVLMNEDDGEVVGTLDRSVRVREDRSLAEQGHERDPVVVELPEGADTVDALMDEEVLVRAIPPEDRDWVLKGAVFVSYAISGTTTLLTRAMTAASNLYIAHSTPSTTSPTPRPNSPSPSSSSSSAPPPPSRTLLILQSPTTRKNLARIHTASGGAVKLSSKAVAAVESLIQRTVGTGGSGSSGKGRAASVFTSGAVPTLPPRSRGPSPAPPDSKPPLPPRHGKSPSPSPSGSRVQSPAPQLHPPPPPTMPLRTRTSLALSAALILASLETSAVRLVEAGGAAVSAAVAHTYGPVAGENAAIAGRTARNIVLVYVDVRGLGRRVIVKRMAKRWVKGRIAEGAAARKK